MNGCMCAVSGLKMIMFHSENLEETEKCSMAIKTARQPSESQGLGLVPQPVDQVHDVDTLFGCPYAQTIQCENDPGEGIL